MSRHGLPPQTVWCLHLRLVVGSLWVCLADPLVGLQYLPVVAWVGIEPTPSHHLCCLVSTSHPILQGLPCSVGLTFLTCCSCGEYLPRLVAGVRTMLTQHLSQDLVYVHVALHWDDTLEPCGPALNLQDNALAETFVALWPVVWDSRPTTALLEFVTQFEPPWVPASAWVPVGA